MNIFSYQNIFYFSFFFVVASYLFVILRIKWFHYFHIIIIGIYFPLIMYLFSWSDLILPNQDIDFYFIFIIFNLLISLFLVFTPKYVQNESGINIKLKNSSFISVPFFIYILSFFLENFIGSGLLLPILDKNIDMHTYSMPVISFITRSPDSFLFLYYIYYDKTKKKRYLFYIIFILLVWPLTRLARAITFLSLLKLILFILLYTYYTKRNIINSLIRKIFVIVMSLVIVLSGLTNYRMKHFNTLSDSYSNYIEYSGPVDYFGVLPVFYGYFPMSYDNLNRSIIHLKSINKTTKTYSLYTYKFLFMDILQMDTIFKIPSQIPIEYRRFSIGAATVPTLFFDLYFDNGLLFFIPLFIGLFFSMFLYCFVLKNRKMYSIAIYCIYNIGWIMASFQNYLFGHNLMFNIIFTYVFFSFYLSSYNCEVV